MLRVELKLDAYRMRCGCGVTRVELKLDAYLATPTSRRLPLDAYLAALI